VASLPNATIRAAVRWLELIPSAGVRRSRALLCTLAEFSDLTPTQYDAAWEWLQRTGVPLESRVPPRQRIFDAYLTWQNPVWLRRADDLVRNPDEIPSDADELAGVLGLSGEEAFSQIRNLSGKVDPQLRAAFGAAGEFALVEYLRQSLDAEIEYVAEWSDGHGYDVEVCGRGRSYHLEVKSSLRRHGFRMFLSRNEYEVMRRDPDWILATVLLSEAGELEWIGSIPSGWIRENCPRDSGVFGRWESVRLNVPEQIQTEGIPELRPLLIESSSLL